MRIALAQINTTVGDFPGNCAKIREWAGRARQAGADLVLFPELAVNGYPPLDLLERPSFIEAGMRALDELAASIEGITAIVGFVERNPDANGNPLSNAAAIIERGRVREIRRKTLLPSYDVFDEDRYFQPARENEPLNIGGRRIGVTVCEDIWAEAEAGHPPRHETNPAQYLCAQGIDLLVNISSSPYYLDKGMQRYNLMRALAGECGVPIAYCNQVGGNDSLLFDGSSLIFDEKGRMVARGAFFEEDLIIADLDELPGEQAPPDFSDPWIIHQALRTGIHDYFHKCGFTRAVVGLSGGIDSAVTAALAAEALGRENVLGVTMPSRYSSAGSVADSEALAKNLGIEYREIPIEPMYVSYLESLSEHFAGKKEDVTEENIQARIRGNILMAFSNKFGHLVLSTGNKSEFAMGYCTLYGDMAGGLAVLSDVPKTLVYGVADSINSEREIIPRSTIEKPPSAELRPNQLDEDSLPPYPVLDEILRLYVEKNHSVGEIVEETGHDEKLVKSIVRTVILNEYKRRQVAPGLKVTSRAFGYGRFYPLAQRFFG